MSILFNAFNLVPVGDPAFEAVTVQEIKDQGRIYQSTDDAYIGLLAIAAREQVEKDLNVAVVQQSYKWVLDHGFFHNALLPPFLIPGSGQGYGYNSYYYDVGFYSLNYYPRLRVPILPVQSITSVTYTDSDGNPQTLDPSNYALKLYKDPPEIWWTGQMPQIQPASDVIINLTAGFTADDDIIAIQSVKVRNGGTGYTDGTYDINVSGTPGTGVVSIVVSGHSIISAAVADPGSGFTDQSNYSVSAFDLSGIGAGASANLTYYASDDVVEPNNAVPELIKAAIKLLAASWYEQRVPVSEAHVSAVPLTYDRIINLIRVKRFF